MKTLTFKTNINCNHCIATVRPFLEKDNAIQDWQVDIQNPDKILTVSGENIQKTQVEVLVKEAGFLVLEEIQASNSAFKKDSFWKDTHTWQRAGLNTLNCLIGCSIGDFAMIIFLQANYPEVSMALQMILAVVAGLATSVAFESILLKIKEGFSWKQAIQTAFSMSFLSMLAMEIVMNSTDFMLTGGKAAFQNPMYWFALLLAMVAGFLAPLPYNYYKLKKFGKACH